MDSLLQLVLKHILLPWSQWTFLARAISSTLLLGSPVLYVYEFFRYKRLAREALTVPHVAPIAVAGGLSRELGSRQAGLILKAHLASITATFRSAERSHGTLHGEVVALVGHSLDFTQIKHLSEYKLEEDVVVKIGNVEIPIRPLLNFLIAMWRVFPLPPRNEYQASLVHVSLLSYGQHTQLIVWRRREATNGAATFNQTKTVRNLLHLSDLLRDAAFMTLQLLRPEALPGRDWLGKRHFVDGLDALEQFGRTRRDALMQEAIESFRLSAEANSANYEALYLYGSLLLYRRDMRSIDAALQPLTRALGTDRSEFRALANAGLATCYTQQIHRLARRDAYVQRMAREHARKAVEEWKAISPDPNPRILSADGMVDAVIGVDVISHKDATEQALADAKQQLLDSARQFANVLSIDPDNGAYYNVLGWILLNLAQSDVELAAAEQVIPPEDIQGAAAKAEYHLLRSLEADPTSKLTHANLCLLYATPWYRKQHYLEFCRGHGRYAVDLDQDYLNGYRDLALSLATYKEFGEAREYFERALQLARQPTPDTKKIQEIVDGAMDVLTTVDASEQEMRLWREAGQRALLPGSVS